MDSIFHPLNGFLHPSEMTPEERLDELAHIFAAGLLRLKAGVLGSEKKSQHIDAVGDKFLHKTESSLEVPGQRRLHVARK